MFKAKTSSIISFVAIIVLSINIQAEDVLKDSLLSHQNFKKVVSVFRDKNLIPANTPPLKIEGYLKNNPKIFQEVAKQINIQLKELELPELNVKRLQVLSQYSMGFSGVLDPGVMLTDGYAKICIPCVVGNYPYYGYYIGASESFKKLVSDPCATDYLKMDENFDLLRKIFLRTFRKRLSGQWEVSIGDDKYPFKLKLDEGIYNKLNGRYVDQNMN